MSGPPSTSPLPPPTRILIVDDQELVRIGLRTLIGEQPELEVCGEAADHVRARLAIQTLLPDVVIVDLMLGSGDGLHLMQWISRHHPGVKIVVHTSHDERTCGLRVLRAGARGYVNKHAPAETLLVAIRRVMQGALFFSEDLSMHLLRLAAVGSPVPLTDVPTDRLSDRELQVFRLLGEGLTADQIAKSLHLSVHTIGTYRERLKQKLDAHNQPELVRMAVEWSLKHS